MSCFPRIRAEKCQGKDEPTIDQLEVNQVTTFFNGKLIYLNVLYNNLLKDLCTGLNRSLN